MMIGLQKSQEMENQTSPAMFSKMLMQKLEMNITGKLDKIQNKVL